MNEFKFLRGITEKTVTYYDYGWNQDWWESERDRMEVAQRNREQQRRESTNYMRNFGAARYDRHRYTRSTGPR